jgi:hypothetical protein
MQNQKTIPQVIQETFQLLPITDPFYYNETILESYTDFSGSGDPNYVTQVSWNSSNSIPKVSPGSGWGLAADILRGYLPSHYKKTLPYSQVISLYYENSYKGIPRIDAQKIVSVTGLVIRNNSYYGGVINYSLNINGSNRQISQSASAAPGNAATFQFPPIEINSLGIEIKINAINMCMGPCIQSQNRTLYGGFHSFDFVP